MNYVPLSYKIHKLHDVFGSISLRYPIVISSAYFVFNGTVITQDINRQINVNANLWPLLVVGSMPMLSTAQPAKGTFGISKYISCVIIWLGKNCAHSLNVLI